MKRVSNTLVISAAAVFALCAAGDRVETQMAPQGKGPVSGFTRELSGFSKEGNAVSGESGNVGVYASNNSSGNKAYLGARCCAGDFYGDVYVHGSIKVDGSKNFVLDHPLDPANKYLYHASIESSEMKNIYDGVVTLDAHGQAVVSLPDWFGALNKDFRYQLTPIGAPGPGLHIKREIANNEFTIAGGLAGMKVSWMVSGVRQDAWAKDHPMPAEGLKPVGERGRYLYPEGWGQTHGAGIEDARHSSER
jgi:hypothetical protein